MFTGFTDETVRFFLDLKFHNSTEYFHQERQRYLEVVQKPFYEMIEALAPEMQQIDPMMEIRPHKCLSHIHRDTRFTKDKSPYRDHLWFLFRRAAEPRDKSLFYFFEFGPSRLAWGMGFWGENRDAMDLFRRRLEANPACFDGILHDVSPESRNLFPGGTVHKRMTVPASVPLHLRRWYCAKELYIGKQDPPYPLAFTEELLPEVRGDFAALAPVYRHFRGIKDEVDQEDQERMG